MSGELEAQLRLVAAQVEQRLSMGDRTTKPREVDHSAAFRRRPSAIAATEELAALGYEVEIQRHLFHVVLEITHLSAVDLDSAEGFAREVVEVVLKHGGDYEGWGAGVVEG